MEVLVGSKNWWSMNSIRSKLDKQAAEVKCLRQSLWRITITRPREEFLNLGNWYFGLDNSLLLGSILNFCGIFICGLYQLDITSPTPITIIKISLDTIKSPQTENHWSRLWPSKWMVRSLGVEKVKELSGRELKALWMNVLQSSRITTG